MRKIQGIEKNIKKELTRQKLTICIAESCTAGLICYRLAKTPGASVYLDRGLIVYSNRAKQELLGVRKKTLVIYGAVSQECVLEMAIGAKKYSTTDLGLAVTGIAGPTGDTSKKPVGTVWFALATPEGISSKQHLFSGNRAIIQVQATEHALFILNFYLTTRHS